MSATDLTRSTARIAAEPGTSTRCVLTDQGMRVGVTATVTSVEGGTANYHVQVDDEPLGSAQTG